MSSAGSTGAIIFGVLGLIFGILGVIFIIVALVSRKKAQTAQGWPVTAGAVTGVDVRAHQDYDEDSGTTTTNFEPVVNYTYNVMGQTYTGSKIAFGANRFDQRTAQNKVAGYAPGSSIQVHYNPQKPADAVLETKVAGGKVFLIVGIVLAVIGLMACCGGLVVMMFTSAS